MIEFEIQTLSRPSVAEEMREALDQARSEWEDAGIEIRQAASAGGYRSGVDPALLIALVGAAGPVLTAFVSGLMRIAERLVERHAAKTIVLQSKTGRLEIPADTPQERIDQYVETLQQMGSEKVWISFE